MPANRAPVARLSGPTSAVVGVEVSFDGSKSTDAPPGIRSWTLTDSEGTEHADGTGQPPASIPVTFRAAGVVDVILTVFDNKRARSTAQITVEVANPIIEPPPLPVDAVWGWGDFIPNADFGPCQPDGFSYGTETRQPILISEARNGGDATPPPADTRTTRTPCLYVPPIDPPPPPSTDGSPIARGVFPRLLLTSEMLVTLRERIRTDPAVKARFQTAVTQVESPKSTWNVVPTDPFACAFGAFLAMVRRPTDDLGLTWTQPWTLYRDRIVSAASGWTRDGRHEQKAIATALIYDCLYTDLTETERQSCAGWVELGFSQNSYMPGGVEVYDNGASDDHAAKLLCALVSPNAADRFAEALRQTLAVADTNDWMGLGFGLGREWHEGYTSRHGLPVLLYALKHAGGLSDAQTIDHFLIHLRDTWRLTRDAIIPHPSVGLSNGAPWASDLFHTQDPTKAFHRGLNVGAHMAWAAAVLPGKLPLSLEEASEKTTVAVDERAYLGTLWAILNEKHPVSGKQLREIFDVTLLGRTTSTHTARFWAFPAWLIYGAVEYPSVADDAAGIPQVRRYWPGTLEWTFIESPNFSRNSGSVIRYTHRRYAASNYEEGCRQNGRWHVHREGPLLVQRGETGHSMTTQAATWCANGCVSFVDPTLYPLFTWNAGDDGDRGGIRDFTGGNTKEQMLAQPSADFGSVTAWHADDRCVAITSDLTRSYNSTLIQAGPLAVNARKLSSFVREFVVIRRVGDGTDREKVFTYDRIQLIDPKFEPRYHLCPATNPHIDGIEREVLPWGPVQGDPAFDWYAVGPTQWAYENATRLIYANDNEPKASIAGKGKVCVTWLQPSGTNVKVTKSGGTNAVSKVKASHNGYPFFSPWRGWQGKDEWNGLSGIENRAYVGLYTVDVSPTVVSKDTRFLMACEVMAVTDSPASAQAVPCDPLSVAARCGATVVVFAKDDVRSSGWVDVPEGVNLVVVVNHGRETPMQFQAGPGRVVF